MKESAAPGTPPAAYVARIRENVTWLAEQHGHSIRRLAGLADLGHQTVRNWLAGTADPTVGNLMRLADVLGVDIGDLLLDHDELREKVAQEGLRPFVLSPALTSSLSGRTASGAKRDRYGKIKGKRTTSRQVGNARYEQVASDLHEAA